MISKKLALLAAGFGLLLSAAVQAALPIQHWKTDNGTRVYFVESHDLPMLDISVDFAAGSAHDTAAKSGLASITRHMLALGAGGVSEDDIAKGLADVGASLGGAFDQDRASYTLRTLSSQRERTQSIALLAKILQQPDFPAPILEREKKRTIAALQEEETQPESIAAKAFYRDLYGSHPYGLPPAGKPETVATLTRDDVAAFYRAHYTAGSAVISLIGDVSRAEAEAIAKDLSSNLPAGAGDSAIPPVAQPAKAEQQTIAHPAKQSHILIGDIGVRRGDPDYFPLFVGNHVLGGGGFTSRLMQDVREKRGLAYSVYSYFEPLRQEGPFVIGLQTKREQTTQALEVVRDTLNEFVASGPKAVELEKAKQNIVLGFPLRIDSNAKILGYLAMIGFYDLPLTYLDDFVRHVERVGVRDVKDAFARRVHPDKMVTVVVGGAE